MTVGRGWRLAGLIVLISLFALAINLLLGMTDRALDLWERLREFTPLARYLLVGVLLGLCVTFFWIAWRLIRPRPKRASTPPMPRNRAALEARADALTGEGVDADTARQTLAELDANISESLDIVLFGAVSTGKSSLAQALLPDAVVEVSPLAGSTTEVRHFVWEAGNGATIRIADLPGLEAVGGELDERMMEMARRSHVVVFVADSDLTRQQVAALDALRAAGKPMIVSLNKADRYDAESLGSVRQSVADRLGTGEDASDIAPVLVVTIAGGEREVQVENPDGTTRTESRARKADIGELVLALEELIGGDLAPLHALRERALLDLAHDQLVAAEANYRAQRASDIVADTTRKAVVGALAAVTPGTDVIIQGYLGTDLTRRLCRLYGQEPGDIEISRFLDLSQSRVGKIAPITLAIAGNALKAFPGIGTIAGGLVHAVAYGIIFDAVGRGLARSLAEAGSLEAERAAKAVSTTLDDESPIEVQRIVRLALSHLGDRKSDD